MLQTILAHAHVQVKEITSTKLHVYERTCMMLDKLKVECQLHVEGYVSLPIPTRLERRMSGHYKRVTSSPYSCVPGRTWP